MQRIDTTGLVDTPERVRFRHRLAGPGQRAVAWLLDLCVQGVVVVLLVLVVVGASAAGEVASGMSQGLALLVWFVVSWFYGAVFELLWLGQTPGKWVTRLRAVKRDGAPLGPADAVLRNLLRGVDGLPVAYAIGGLVAAVDGKMRRLGDLVADTVVVHEIPVTLLDDAPIEPPVSASERRGLPGRVVLSRSERRAIEDLLRRAPLLGPARSEELAGHLGPVVAERTGIQADTWLRTLTLAFAVATGRVG